MRCPVEDLSIVGRNTMGVTVMQLDDGDRVAAVDVIDADRMEADDEAEDEAEAQEEAAE